MKRVINLLMVGLALASVPAFAQKTTEDRMKRDIAVMETALSEMIKQEFDQRNFFFIEVKGNYVSGYGVTFTVPTGMFTSVWGMGGNDITVVDGNVDLFKSSGNGFTYSYSEDASDAEVAEMEAIETKEAMKSKNSKSAQKERNKAEREAQVARDKGVLAEQEAREAERQASEVAVYGLPSPNGVVAYAPRHTRKRVNNDSLHAVNNAKIIEAAKTFIADYGDVLSQLAPAERIVVTNNAADETQFWFNGQKAKRSLLSVEANKSDLTQFRQGNLTRDQLLKKMKVVNTTTSEKKEPDMELLASIFNRLYREDLSRTYYMQGGAYYERLNDFGVILHMQVVSSTSNGDMYTPAKDVRLYMPTQGLTNLTQEERDKKVKELYPLFENELKENMLDYGRTLKSLKDNEQLIVDVGMTKCIGCGIPVSLEMSVKASVLKDFNAGKLERSAAMSKIEVKKGPNQ